MKKQLEIHIPLAHYKELEELQNTLVSIISILNKEEDLEIKQQCIYWLSRILLFSEYLS